MGFNFAIVLCLHIKIGHEDSKLDLDTNGTRSICKADLLYLTQQAVLMMVMWPFTILIIIIYGVTKVTLCCMIQDTMYSFKGKMLGLRAKNFSFKKATAMHSH